MTLEDDPAKDFSFLLQPQSYHPLPPATTTTPVPFQKPPSTDIPLEALLHKGSYTLAATTALGELLASPAPPLPRIITLFHIRLLALSLLPHTLTLAALESKILGDLSSPIYLTSASTGGQTHILPFSLRILATRLQSHADGSWRRGVAGLYDLAREARLHATSATASNIRAKWSTHLQDLGLNIASALVEVGDHDGAGRLLDTMRPPILTPNAANPRLDRHHLYRALIYLRLGDVSAALSLFPAESTTPNAQVVRALALVANGAYTESSTAFRNLIQHDAPHKELLFSNLATSLLYTGDVQAARTLYEELVTDGFRFHGLTFNLSTVYELCAGGNTAQTLKAQLASKLAERDVEHDWEKSDIDFKL